MHRRRRRLEFGSIASRGHLPDKRGVRMSFPEGAARRFGSGAPSFGVRPKDKNAVRAITSLDQVKFADTYLAGDIDIDGEMLRPFELRQTLGDMQPLMTAWRFLQPLLLGQVRTNQAAITSHYDIEPEFFLNGYG
jgi:cyclopropane-fatty-acyl-phospholipid synthase